MSIDLIIIRNHEDTSALTAAPEKFSNGNGHYSILVVDDEPNVRDLMREFLEAEGYQVIEASNGSEAAASLSASPPHLIISDYAMPGMNGLELLGLALEKAPDAARILCTGYADVQIAIAAINRGAVNRILTKPFDPAVLLKSVHDCVEQVRLRTENMELFRITQKQNEKLERWTQELEKEVATRTAHIGRVTQASISSLADLAESRARDIGGHLRRMQEMTRILAENLMSRSDAPEHLTPEYIDDLYTSTLLHDVGKVGIPDGILFKPGKLSPEEFSVMKTHASIGQETIQKAQARIGDKSFLTLGVAIAGHHHERWDGKGYPKNLSEFDIPLAARIVSLADVYDALTSPRVYKEAWSHDNTIEYMVEGSGTQFDPRLMEILKELEKDFRAIRENWKE